MMNASSLALLVVLASGVSLPVFAHTGAKQEMLAARPSYFLTSEKLADGGDYVGTNANA